MTDSKMDVDVPGDIVDNKNDVTIEQVRQYFTSHGMQPTAAAIMVIGPNLGRDIYPINLSHMAPCSRMRENHADWVSRGYNNMLLVSGDHMALRYTS